jgi:hypothetical protein
MSTALSRRQLLDRCQERQLDGLPSGDHRFRLFLAGCRRAQQPVGVGLQPRQVHRREFVLVWVGRCCHVGRPSTWLAAAQGVEAHVRGYAVQPRTERRARAEAVELRPGTQVGLLDRVLGVLDRTEHPVAVHLQFAPVGLGQPVEGARMTRPCLGHEDFVHVYTTNEITPIHRSRQRTPEPAGRWPRDERRPRPAGQLSPGEGSC